MSTSSYYLSLEEIKWGRFLGRQEELRRLQQWADHQRYPIAVLYGFGGNGKTTIQQKVGEEYVHGGMESNVRFAGRMMGLSGYLP